MDKRILGRSGVEVSALGMGCWAIGGPFGTKETPYGWGDVNDAESITAIHKALDMGITLFDTADVYGAGHSEIVLGQALGSKRKDVVIATKFGYSFNEDTRETFDGNASAEYIRQAVEGSLRRLNTDYIDLYQLHMDEELTAEDGHAVRDALEELVQAGKIRGYGWSTDSVDKAAAFRQGEHNFGVQFGSNVLDVNRAMIAFCDEQNVAGLNRGPLAMGILTGKFSKETVLADDDVRGPLMTQSDEGYFNYGKPNAKLMTQLEAIREVLRSEGRTLAQGAIAWLWAASPMMLPIPGFKSVAQVEENAGALQYGPLTADQMAEIDRILERDRVLS